MITAVMPTYARYDVALERGEGVYAFGTDGRRYLDFGAGIAVASLGHCHPHLVKALKTQAETLWHVSNLYNIPGQERLAERLVANTFADAVFFNNSGNEAVELGFKMIRKFQSESATRNATGLSPLKAPSTVVRLPGSRLASNRSRLPVLAR